MALSFRPLVDWWDRLVRGFWDLDLPPSVPVDNRGVERPWNYDWQWVTKRTAGPGFGPADYHTARKRAIEVARLTFGEENWQRIQKHGFLDVRSRKLHGLTYRLRVGRRIELIWDGPAAQRHSPWPYNFLCINPTYPLPAEEFAAHLYLYVRDREEEIIRRAAPQPFDQLLGRVF